MKRGDGTAKDAKEREGKGFFLKREALLFLICFAFFAVRMLLRLRMELEEIGREVVDSAVKVHRALGPGLLESAYQRCLCHELRKRGLSAEEEVMLPISYDGNQIDAGYRVDILVENRVVIENKAVDKVLPIHQAQLLTYLKLRGLHLGFLINWNVVLIKDGIQRMVHNLPDTKH